MNVLQLTEIFRLTEVAEGRMWSEVAARFFDKTNKRVDPENLKKTLGGDFKFRKDLL